MNIIVGLSGGVDSAIAAYLLKQQGHNVCGLFMKNWEDDDNSQYCSSRQDLIDATAVADVIGIDIEAVNFAKEYKERVFAYFLQEYNAGRTPNPDIFCNSEIKFAAFLDHALRLGADKIATGHYAGVREFDGKFQLLKAEDGTKDQSYFLHRLNQQQLSKSVFPLQNLYKSQVRKLAAEIGLSVANKKDSTGICFIGERPFKEFLQKYLPKQQRGEIRHLDSNQLLGYHDGVAFHTIGQRKGLKIGGNKNFPENLGWFVADKDIKNNILYVVQGHNHPALQKTQIMANNLSFVAGEIPHLHWVYTAKPRYRTADQVCTISANNDNQSISIDFATPQWAITAGQSVVLYESNVCLGGGIIQ